jgi:mannose-6-phosphate isomerase-like protein (cupin superfamily)
MRVLTAASMFILALNTMSAQPVAAQTAPDGTTAAHVTTAEIMAAVAAMPADQNATQRILQAAGYSVGIEHRVSVPQAASVHDAEAELFYLIDGSATLVTGGTLIEPTHNGSNWSGKGVAGGTARKLGKGDFVMVPAGVPHWFTDIDGAMTDMSLHLPVMPAR